MKPCPHWHLYNVRKESTLNVTAIAERQEIILESVLAAFEAGRDEARRLLYPYHSWLACTIVLLMIAG